MAWLLLLLLLLYRVCIATTLPQDWWCAVHDKSVPATKIPHLPDAPCTHPKGRNTLALPVLLSLKNPHQDGYRVSEWGMKLYLLDGTGVQQGLAMVRWRETSEITMWGFCCSLPLINSSLAAPLPGSWLHLMVEAEGQQVTLNLLRAKQKVTIVTIAFQDDLPSMVTIDPYIKRTGLDDGTSTTKTVTPQPLVVIIAALVVFSVGMSVAMVVLVWRGWLGMVALERVLLGAQDKLALNTKDNTK